VEMIGPHGRASLQEPNTGWLNFLSNT